MSVLTFTPSPSSTHNKRLVCAEWGLWVSEWVATMCHTYIDREQPKKQKKETIGLTTRSVNSEWPIRNKDNLFFYFLHEQTRSFVLFLCFYILRVLFALRVCQEDDFASGLVLGNPLVSGPWQSPTNPIQNSSTNQKEVCEWRSQSRTRDNSPSNAEVTRRSCVAMVVLYVLASHQSHILPMGQNGLKIKEADFWEWCVKIWKEEWDRSP